MLVLIDNYDSFSYNLYQMCGAIERDIRVVRNNAVTLDDIRALAPDHIILSPGPGRPCDAGICEDAVRTFAGSIPILGVCLGHQAICETYGGKITHARRLMHGKQSVVSLDHRCPLFDGLGDRVPVARYHSLIGTDLPQSLTVVSTDDIGEVMAVMDRKRNVYGLQFHPESILTPDGAQILANFLRI